MKKYVDRHGAYHCYDLCVVQTYEIAGNICNDCHY